MKMTKFIELNTIGVSKDSQLRAAKILKATSDSCGHHTSGQNVEKFFEFGFNQMKERWRKLNDSVTKSGIFSLPEFAPDWCTYNQKTFQPQPGNSHCARKPMSGKQEYSQLVSNS